MGEKMSKMNHSRWFGKNHRRVLCLGLQGSGKSCLTQNLVSQFPRAAKPLPELGCYKFKVDKFTIAFYDLKGDAQSRFFWRHHFEGSQGVIFVVDMSNADNIQLSKEMLQELLRDDLLRGLPFLIVANKKDIAIEYSEDQIIEMLNLDKNRRNEWEVVKASALSGEGLREGLLWILARMSPV